jgi:hypothetical protein
MARDSFSQLLTRVYDTTKDMNSIVRARVCRRPDVHRNHNPDQLSGIQEHESDPFQHTPPPLNHDFGPLLRFNFYVLYVLQKYSAHSAHSAHSAEELQRLDEVRSALGAGPVFVSSSRIRRNQTTKQQTADESPSFIHPYIQPMVSGDCGLVGKDAAKLTLLGIHSPSFVLHKDVPFCESEKISTNTTILNVMKKLNPSLDRSDAYMELHVMWKVIDYKKWHAFASHDDTAPPRQITNPKPKVLTNISVRKRRLNPNSTKKKYGPFVPTSMESALLVFIVCCYAFAYALLAASG